jgi:ankyrin repeat protein
MGELVEATLRSDYVAIKKAIASGDNPNLLVDGMTPLLWAVFRGDVDAVRLLLEAGADPNVRPNPSDSPLWHAADDFGLPEITALLKSHGATK